MGWQNQFPESVRTVGIIIAEGEAVGVGGRRNSMPIATVSQFPCVLKVPMEKRRMKTDPALFFQPRKLGHIPYLLPLGGIWNVWTQSIYNFPSLARKCSEPEVMKMRSQLWNSHVSGGPKTFCTFSWLGDMVWTLSERVSQSLDFCLQVLKIKVREYPHAWLLVPS